MTTPIRVLHPITRLIVGGAQENTMITADTLAHAPEYAGRYRVDVVSGSETGPEGSLIEEVRARGVPLTIIPSLRRALDPLSDVRAYRALVRLMRAPRGGPAYDIVHTHSSKAGVLGRLAARAARVPVVVHTVHGWSFHDRMPPGRRATYVALERLAARAGHKMIAVTPLDIDKGLERGVGHRDDYVVVRSGIELDRFMNPSRSGEAVRAELGIPPGATVVGSVTRLSPQKAPLDLVAAFARLSRARADVRFLVVGDGPLRPEVEAAIAREGLTGRIVLTGLRRDVPELLGAMDVFALSSLWEGLPRVVLQAMAARLPVVATAADGTAEVVRDGVTGHLVERGRLDDFAGHLTGLVDDPERRQAMGEAGHAAVEPFGARHMVTELDRLYRELLARRGRTVAPGEGSVALRPSGRAR
jgi:glycosyltransferase involved in cell wall biosynthesis